MQAVCWKLYGRVQGVGLREWICQCARALQLLGGVRNEADGSVRLYVRGPAVSIEHMRTALLHLHRPFGPHIERIEEVECAGPEQQAPPQGGAAFVILD